MDHLASSLLPDDIQAERERAEPPALSSEEMKARARAALGGGAKRVFRALQDWPADEPETMGPETYEGRRSR